MEKFVCRMLLRHQGRTAHYDVDLLLAPEPTAVLEWARYPDGTSIPGVALQLDPRWQMDSPIPLSRS